MAACNVISFLQFSTNNMACKVPTLERYCKNVIKSEYIFKTLLKIVYTVLVINTSSIRNPVVGSMPEI